jgi:probable addiction module antidote protein
MTGEGKMLDVQDTRSRSHDEAIGELFREDPALSAEYLNITLKEGSQEEFLFALRRVVKTFGGVARVASATGLNENTLHRTLSARGNPRLSTLAGICKAVGMEISISPRPHTVFSHSG